MLRKSRAYIRGRSPIWLEPLFLDTRSEALTGASLMRQMGVADTKKATSKEVASDGLLRLGLNQRPSD